MNYSLTDLVKGRTVCFRFYSDGNLHYDISGTDLVYPIPIEDTKGGTFYAEHKAIEHMRWIRPYLEMIKKWANSSLEA
tara:strand:+ start:1010 stop:1243 length:234 start_codon:yes stop_codon:yes gene_type:complete